jgi:O-antigen ligase
MVLARFVGPGLILTFVLFFFWPHPPLSWLLLAAALVLAWIRLEAALALLPLTFPYYLDLKPLTSSGFPAFSLIELGLFICVGVALLRHTILPKERYVTREWLHRLWQEGRSLLLPALLFLLGASLALLVAPDHHDSLRAYREEIVEPLVYFLLIARYLRTRDDLARAIGALILSALVAAGMGIIQGLFHITNDLFYVDAHTFRINGPYGSPNNLAFLIDRTLPLLLALTFIGVFRRREHHTALRPAWRDPLRWLCLALMLPLLWALYWTGSRGAELALLVVCFLLVVFEVRSWVIPLILLGAGGVGVGLFWGRIVRTLNGAGHGILSERFLLWKAGLLIIRDHFFFGAGPDSFNTLYSPTAPNSYALKALDGQPFPAAYNPHLSHPHNFILDFWISTGLLGIIAFCWLLGALALLIRRVYHLCAPLRGGQVLQRLLVGIAGSLIATIVHGLVDNSYFVPDLAMIFWFFAGMLLLIQHIVLREQRVLREKRAALESSVLDESTSPAPLL